MVRTIGLISVFPHPVFDLPERGPRRVADQFDFTRSNQRRIGRDVLGWSRLQLKFPECFV